MEPDDVTVTVVTVMATWGPTLGPEAGWCRVPCRHLHPSCGAHSWVQLQLCSSKVQSGSAAESMSRWSAPAQSRFPFHCVHNFPTNQRCWLPRLYHRNFHTNCELRLLLRIQNARHIMACASNFDHMRNSSGIMGQILNAHKMEQRC